MKKNLFIREEVEEYIKNYSPIKLTKNKLGFKFKDSDSILALKFVQKMNKELGTGLYAPTFIQGSYIKLTNCS